MGWSEQEAEKGERERVERFHGARFNTTTHTSLGNHQLADNGEPLTLAQLSQWQRHVFTGGAVSSYLTVPQRQEPVRTFFSCVFSAIVAIEGSLAGQLFPMRLGIRVAGPVS